MLKRVIDLEDCRGTASQAFRILIENSILTNLSILMQYPRKVPFPIFGDGLLKVNVRHISPLRERLMVTFYECWAKPVTGNFGPGKLGPSEFGPKYKC